jgi:hypothetical protein
VPSESIAAEEIDGGDAPLIDTSDTETGLLVNVENALDISELVSCVVNINGADTNGISTDVDAPSPTMFI